MLATEEDGGTSEGTQQQGVRGGVAGVAPVGYRKSY